MDEQAILQYLMQTGQLNSEEDDLGRQMQMAQALRQRSGPAEAMQAGGMTVAASPLSHLASGAGQYMASRDERGIRPGMKSINDRRKQAVDAMGRTAGINPAVGMGAGDGMGSYGGSMPSY